MGHLWGTGVSRGDEGQVRIVRRDHVTGRGGGELGHSARIATTCIRTTRVATTGTCTCIQTTASAVSTRAANSWAELLALVLPQLGLKLLAEPVSMSSLKPHLVDSDESGFLPSQQRKPRTSPKDHAHAHLQ